MPSVLLIMGCIDWVELVRITFTRRLASSQHARDLTPGQGQGESSVHLVWGHEKDQKWHELCVNCEIAAIIVLMVRSVVQICKSSVKHMKLNAFSSPLKDHEYMPLRLESVSEHACSWCFGEHRQVWSHVATSDMVTERLKCHREGGCNLQVVQG
jgi:hypothetical protein